MSNFKQPILRDEKWLKHVRHEMQCMYTGSPHPDPAHIRFGGMGGMGLKPADNLVLPMSTVLHAQQHQIGEVTFHRMYLPKLSDFSLMFFMRSGAKELHRMWKDGELPENFFAR